MDLCTISKRHFKVRRRMEVPKRPHKWHDGVRRSCEISAQGQCVKAIRLTLMFFIRDDFGNRRLQHPDISDTTC